jgi:DNA-binding phage protein
MAAKLPKAVIRSELHRLTMLGHRPFKGTGSGGVTYVPRRQRISGQLVKEISALLKWREQHGEIMDEQATRAAFEAATARKRLPPSGKVLGEVLKVHLVEVLGAGLTYLHAVDESIVDRRQRLHLSKMKRQKETKERQRRTSGVPPRVSGVETKAEIAKSLGISRTKLYRIEKYGENREKLASHPVSETPNETPSSPAYIYMAGETHVSPTVSQSVSAETMARQLGISRAHFYRLLKAAEEWWRHAPGCGPPAVRTLGEALRSQSGQNDGNAPPAGAIRIAEKMLRSYLERDSEDRRSA